MATRRVTRQTDSDKNVEALAVRRPINAVLTIACALAFGCFLVWIVRLDWVLNLMAGVFLLAVVALGIAAGRAVYQLLSPTLYHWERVTIAVIIGFAVGLAFAELTHSHKLIRDYDNYGNSGDD